MSDYIPSLPNGPHWPWPQNTHETSELGSTVPTPIHSQSSTPVSTTVATADATQVPPPPQITPPSTNNSPSSLTVEVDDATPSRATSVTSSAVPGNSKDNPGLHYLRPEEEHDNAQSCDADGYMTVDAAANTLLSLRDADARQRDHTAACSLLALRANHPRAYDSNNDDDDEEEEEAPLDPVPFSVVYRGRRSALSASEGNAIFDLGPRLDLEYTHDEEVHNGKAGVCKACERVDARLCTKYEKWYKEGSFDRSEREETVSADGTVHEEDDDEYRDRMTTSCTTIDSSSSKAEQKKPMPPSCIAEKKKTLQSSPLKKVHFAIDTSDHNDQQQQHHDAAQASSSSSSQQQQQQQQQRITRLRLRGPKGPPPPPPPTPPRRAFGISRSTARPSSSSSTRGRGRGNRRADTPAVGEVEKQDPAPHSNAASSSSTSGGMDIDTPALAPPPPLPFPLPPTSRQSVASFPFSSSTTHSTRNGGRRARRADTPAVGGRGEAEEVEHDTHTSTLKSASAPTLISAFPLTPIAYMSSNRRQGLNLFGYLDPERQRRRRLMLAEEQVREGERKREREVRRVVQERVRRALDVVREEERKREEEEEKEREREEKEKEKEERRVRKGKGKRKRRGERGVGDGIGWW